MSIILFILVLAVLVLVHEFGHFIVAKKNGIRVDEFGIGYPPKLWGFRPKGSETEYSINIIPFGGFVKIFGENGVEKDEAGYDRSFTSKPKRIQIAVLAAGVFFNFLFAWALLSAAFVVGMPASAEDNPDVVDAHVMVTSVLPDSPAEESGLKPGDEIVAFRNETESISGEDLTVPVLQDAIAQSDTLTLSIKRGDLSKDISLDTASGIVEGIPAIGISMDKIGTLHLPFYEAIGRGLVFSFDIAKQVVVGFGTLIAGIFSGGPDLSNIAGPVGIVGIVGDSAMLGFVYLLTITALISINLAVLNLIPFPALDGGRIFFILIEALKGSPISPKISQRINLAGFALLIILMLVVTYHDIAKLLT